MVCHVLCLTLTSAVRISHTVIGASKEPIKGWSDSIYGPTGLMVVCGKGALRSFYCDGDKIADFIPVDLVVNLCIASGW